MAGEGTEDHIVVGGEIVVEPKPGTTEKNVWKLCVKRSYY